MFFVRKEAVTAVTMKLFPTYMHFKDANVCQSDSRMWSKSQAYRICILNMLDIHNYYIINTIKISYTILWIVFKHKNSSAE
jgi:hypothetical protein